MTDTLTLQALYSHMVEHQDYLSLLALADLLEELGDADGSHALRSLPQVPVPYASPSHPGEYAWVGFLRSRRGGPEKLPFLLYSRLTHWQKRPWSGKYYPSRREAYQALFRSLIEGVPDNANKGE